MDYINGADAAHILDQKYPAGMPIDLILPIVDAVASALDYAHKKGLLHRDVKPANIIVADLDTDDPSVFLADFGIARPLDDASGITTTNMTVGTVAYSAQNNSWASRWTAEPTNTLWPLPPTTCSQGRSSSQTRTPPS